ncbi:hypothetical protein PSECIP111951_03865 [Pseudoalteromonas holothuriae]|uniref:Cell wall-active antibiotics response LiaF-like C-terminal domain-containing protein n=1 Tax=Pseudoalteromonas holothuriae TaxID=2963714 RepID=A0A9W4VVZ7_9GAMM|nr:MULTISPECIES: cell wall-active antibiotics response protein [unclassified Pseudoalteromonas]CAH9066696.1 hypothetical protein PSECIP111854_03941 [Pseudoalteromonas sp. CIP111854]CAH9067687.1 hypothetical protein PSECIP111951_03865 [Pseudoalteromonas sp. CIP111951]
MPVPINDRPVESVREEVIDQLILNYSHGEISADAFERRLDKAYSLSEPEQLQALAADLPLQSDPRYHSEKQARMQPKFTASEQHPDTLNITSILSSDQRTGEWIVPKHIHLNNYFSGIELDFRNAIFTHPEVTIEVNCIFGSDEIIVPENIDVITNTTNILGQVSNNRAGLSSNTYNTQRPKLYIQGKVILGSVDISVKKTMQEKVRQFADSLKSLFDEKGSS